MYITLLLTCYAGVMIHPTDHEGALPPAERIILRSPTDSVYLQQLVPDDAPAVFNLIAYDPGHLRQHGDDTADRYPDVASVATSIEHPDNPDKYRFGIWDEQGAGRMMVGRNNLTPKSETVAELGSFVGKQYLGRNYAARGRTLLIDFAFNTLGMEEVYCDIAIGNEASRRSVEGTGFQIADILKTTADDGTVEEVWRYVLDKDT
jgi:RimJ/RimL family protein N-acetyltransferase